MAGMRTWRDSDRGQGGKRAQCGQRAFKCSFLGAKEHGKDDAHGHRTPVSLVSTGQITVERHVRLSFKGPALGESHERGRKFNMEAENAKEEGSRANLRRVTIQVTFTHLFQ